MKGISKQIVLTILLIIYLLTVALSGLLFTLQEMFNPQLELPLRVVIELFFYVVTLYFFLGRFEIIKFFKGLGIFIIARVILSLGVAVALGIVGSLPYIDALREALYGYFLVYLFQILVTPFLSYPVLGMLLIKRPDAEPSVVKPKQVKKRIETLPAVSKAEPDEEILESAWAPLEEEKEVVEVEEEQKPEEVVEEFVKEPEEIMEAPPAPEVVEEEEEEEEEEKKEEIALEESASIWSEEVSEPVELAPEEMIQPRMPEVEKVPVKSAPNFVRLSLRQIFDLNKDNPCLLYTSPSPRDS